MLDVLGNIKLGRWPQLLQHRISGTLAGDGLTAGLRQHEIFRQSERQERPLAALRSSMADDATYGHSSIPAITFLQA
jgi:hypothetical protein